MRKVIYFPILFFVLLFSFKTTKAVSILGTETRWRNLGSDTFEISLVIYFKCPVPSTYYPNQLVVTSDSCSNSYSTNPGSILTVDSIDVTSVCAAQSSVCPNGQATAQVPFGVEKVTYKYKLYLGGAFTNCCWYKVHWDICCRTSTITTGYADYTFLNDVWLNRCVMNNSPKFSNDPLIIKCAGQDVTYNNNAIDDEGDSLSYRLVAPTPGNYSSPWSYTYPVTCLGNNNPNVNANPPTGFNLDSFTGNIMFRPMQVQISVIKIEVTEWRKINGVNKIIGKTYRDIQIAIIQNCNNKLPSLSGPFNIQACSGQQYCLPITTNDQDLTDTTRIYSNVLSIIPNATWNVRNDTVKRASGTFCWTPVDSNISSLPYYFSVVVKDNHCPLFGTISRSYSILVKKALQYSTSYSWITGPLWKFKAIPTDTISASTFQWFVPKLLSQGLPTQYLDYNTTTYYNFPGNGRYLIRSLMTNGGNCVLERIDTIDINCATPLQIKSSNDTNVCKGSPVILTTKALTGTPPYKYNWYRWDVNPYLIDTTQTITTTPLINTKYIVIVKSSDSCFFESDDTISVNVDTTSLSIIHTKDIRICKGALVNLTPQILGTKVQSYYRWFYNGTFISPAKTLVHRPSVSGIYIFEIQSNGACPINVRDTINIFVDTAMLALTPMKDTMVCLGNSVSLTPIIKTGKPPYKYKWWSSNGLLIDTTTSINVLVLNFKNYFVEVTSGDSCSPIARDTVSVYIDTTGLVVNKLKDIFICKSAPVQLTPTIVNGKIPLQYYWYKNNLLVSTNDTLIDIPIVPTDYTLKIVSSDNCNNIFYDTLSVSFIPNTLVIKIPKDTTICANTPVTLSAQVSGASSPYKFNWCPQGKICNTSSTPIYSFDTTTQVILDVTASDLCSSAKHDTIMVHVFPLRQIIISAPITTINKGQSIVLKSNALFTYTWSGVGIITNWGDSILIKPGATSSYYLVGANTFGCRDTGQITINVNTTGIIDMPHPSINFSIFPNPANSGITLSCNDHYGLKCSVYNTLGQLIESIELQETDTYIDIRSWSAGLYFIGIDGGVRKFVKK